MHSQGNDNNDHQTSSVIGLAEMPKGSYKMTIQVSGNGRDCYTGWDPESKGTFLMEAREVKGMAAQEANNQGGKVLPDNSMYGYNGWSSRGSVRGEDNMFPIINRRLAFTKK